MAEKKIFLHDVDVEGDLTIKDILLLGQPIQSGTERVIEAAGASLDIGIDLKTKGSGIVRVPTGYEAYISGNDRALINYGYFKSHVLGLEASALAQAPTASEDQYALLYDHATTKWDLKAVALANTYTDGVNKSGTTVRLGGDIDEVLTNVRQIAVGDIYLQAEMGTGPAGLKVYTAANNDNRAEMFYGATSKIAMSNDAFVITANVTGSMRYAADYSGLFTSDRSIPDKGWINTHIGGKLVTPTVTSPAGTEDGWVVYWDNVLGKYSLKVSVADTFLGLTDTPSSYTGHANKVVAVKADETGLEFITGGGGSGHVIKNSGTPLATQPSLNFTNGLTAVDDNPNTASVVKLGGTLIEDTAITSSGQDLYFYTDPDGGGFDLYGYNAAESAYADLGIYGTGVGLGARIDLIVNNAVGNTSLNVISELTSHTILVSSTYASFEGVKYNANYSANFVARSLIDKGYADATYAPISGGAYWSLASGGTLTGHNTISGNFNKYFTGTGSFIIGHNSVTGSARLQVRGIGTTTGNLVLFEDNAGTERFKVLDNGDTYFSRLISGSDIGIGASDYLYIRKNEANLISIKLINEDTSNGVSINLSGRNETRLAKFSVDNLIEIGSVSNTGIGFVTNNTTRISITNTGLVGIGTSGPSANLDVNGTTRLRQGFYADTSITSPSPASFRLMYNTTTWAPSGTVSSDFEGLHINTTVNATINFTGRIRGLIYNPTLTNLGGATRHDAIVTSSGLHGFGTLTPTATVDIKSYGTTTGLALRIADSANTVRFEFQDNGYAFFYTVPQNDDALTQVLVRDGGTGEIKYRTAGSLGSGGSYWALTGTSTLTGVATITSNAASQHIFDGTWTATANNQYHINITGSYTARNTISDTLYGVSITPTLIAGATGQTLTALYINPTFTAGGFSPIENVVDVRNGSTSLLKIDSIGRVSGRKTTAGVNAIDWDFGSTENYSLTIKQALSGTTANVRVHANVSALTVADSGGNSKGRFIYNGGGGYVGFESTDNTMPVTVFIPTVNSTSGTFVSLRIKDASTAFNPTSGTATFKSLEVNPVYNVTGGTTTIYGIDYNPTLTSVTGATQIALRATSGQVVFGHTAVVSNNRLGVRGIGTTTGLTLLLEDSAGTDRFGFQDNGYAFFYTVPQNDDALTQVLVRDNTTGEIKYRSAATLGGGGGTPGGSANELQKNDGASGFAGTKLFSSTDGYLTLGDSSTALTSRIIGADGSGSDININIEPKGVGGIILGKTSSPTTQNVISRITENHIIEANTAVTNSVHRALALQLKSSGTEAAGIGTGISFAVETSGTNLEIGGLIDIVTTDVGAGTEDFDFVVSLMRAGAAASEKFRVLSTGAWLMQDVTDAPGSNPTNAIYKYLDATTKQVKVRDEDGNIYDETPRNGTITIELYNGGSDLTTGIKDTPVQLPYSGTVVGWEIMAYDASNALLSTNCVVDILSDTFANLPLAGTDSIAGTEKPTLSGASTASDNTITTWSSLTGGNYIQAEIESVDSGVKKIVVTIKVKRTS